MKKTDNIVTEIESILEKYKKNKERIESREVRSTFIKEKIEDIVERQRQDDIDQLSKHSRD